MRTRINVRFICLVLAMLLLAGPGFTLLKYFTITTKKLAHPNPTLYVFHMNAEEMRRTLWKSYCYFCAQDTQPACANTDGLRMDSPSKVVMEPGYWRKSETYFWLGRPLDYHADYAVRVAPRGESMTEVRVETSNAEVAIGPSFGVHGGNLDRGVAPTTVEEYRFLRTIGCEVGEKEMPPLEMPQQRRLALYFKTNAEQWLKLRNFYDLECERRAGKVSEMERQVRAVGRGEL